MTTLVSIDVRVNGEERAVAADATMADLLHVLGLDPDGTGTAVAVNYVVVRKADWRQFQLNQGDEIEIVTATQGG